MTSRAPLFVMEGAAGHFVLKFLEPAGSCGNTLWQRLHDRTYGKPFVLEFGKRRYLYLDRDNIQSAMHVQRPDGLSLGYTRTMMAFLLFNAVPSRILMLGLGGGSMAKFCYHRLPSSVITAIEVSADVIALREEFCIPRDDARFRVIHADGAAYLSGKAQRKDVILADACDAVGIAPELDTPEFYQSVWHRLSAAGVFVMNLCGDRSRWHSHLERLRLTFGKSLMTLRTRSDSNVIVFAFKGFPVHIQGEQLDERALNLQKRFGIDFPRYVKAFALDSKLRSCHATRG